ncbi:MAG: hypothetical protein FD126_1929 [Elusimicrobia bacterium]|nr:MAG: hypothetical protein FD126_1929 [Elusimicrobiota bacterium]
MLKRARGTLLTLGACLLVFRASAQAPQVPPQAHRYAAIHSLALTVRDVKAARAKVEAALKGAGAVSTVAPENQVGSDKVGYAQWSYAVPVKALQKLLKRLRKLGKVTRDVRQPSLPTEGGEVPTDKVLLNIAVDGPPVPEKT